MGHTVIHHGNHMVPFQCHPSLRKLALLRDTYFATDVPYFAGLRRASRGKVALGWDSVPIGSHG